MVGWEKRNGSASLAVKWHFEHNGADLSAEIPSQMALSGGDFVKNENSAVCVDCLLGNCHVKCFFGICLTSYYGVILGMHRAVKSK